MQTAQARAFAFENTESPTSRFPRLVDGSLRATDQGPPSVVRQRIAGPSFDETERMASYAALYKSLENDLDKVIDPTRVLVLTGFLPEKIACGDKDVVRLLRLINGVSSVADVIESSEIDRARAVALLCTLIVERAVTFL